MADKPKLGSDRPKNTGNAGKGRPKGSVNKTTLAAKEAIALAAEKLGGTDRLVEWVQENEKNEHTFWGTIYPKLLPVQLSGEDGGPVRTALEWRIVGE